VLVIAFPILAVSAGLEGAAVAFTASAYVGLGLFIRATRASVGFPWAGIARIGVVVGGASVAAWWIVQAAPTFAGLFVSGITYLAVVAGLGMALDRPLAIRILALVPLRR
jgi:hypothetical protein